MAVIPLEQPRLHSGGDTAARLAELERYLYRLVAQLQTVLAELERQK